MSRLKLSRLIEIVERSLGTVAVLSHDRPKTASVVVLAVTLGMAVLASRLALVADLTELLPETFPSVQDLEIVKDRFGGVGFVVVVGMNADPDALRRFADDLAPKLEALEEVRYVEYRRPAAFFEDRLLYFVNLEDLEVIYDRVKARYDWERMQRNPLLIDLEHGEPPPLDFTDIQDRQRARADQNWMRNQLGEAYYVDSNKQIVALLAKPASPSMKLELAQRLVSRVKEVVGQMDLKQYGDAFEVGFTGRYTRAVDQQALIKHDLRVSSIVALLLVLVYLGIHFRRVLAVGLIMTPLVVGLVWTFGFAQLIFGNLNILTGFIGAILLGLGIDHGIHLLGRYEAERDAGQSERDAIRNTFGNTGRAVTVAALTTTVGFAGLGMSEFRAFHEFGIIAGIGMLVVVAAYVTGLPALIGIATGFGWAPRAGSASGRSWYAQRLPDWALRIVVVAAVLIGVAASQITRTSFNYDFRALEASHLPSFLLDEEVNQLLGYSQSPVVVLTETMEEERIVAAAMRKRQQSLGDATTVDFVLATTDLIPTEQAAKRAVIEKLDGIVEKIKPSWLEPSQRKHLPLARRMTKAEPFQREDLPPEVRRQFQGQGGSEEQGFVLAFPAIDITIGSEVSRFAKEVRGVPLPDGRRVSAAGEDMILADIFDMVTSEAPPVLTLTLVLVFLTLVLLLGSLRLAALCLTPAVITLAVTLGLMPWVGLELNYLNIVMIPVLFGIGVDGGAHIVTRLKSGQELRDVVAETGRAISGAILTTGLGFGALMIADHPGLDSLGSLAVLGLAVNALASLVVLPGFLAWRPVAAVAPAEEPDTNES